MSAADTRTGHIRLPGTRPRQSTPPVVTLIHLVHHVVQPSTFSSSNGRQEGGYPGDGALCKYADGIEADKQLGTCSG